jgi:hypothetical protein
LILSLQIFFGYTVVYDISLNQSLDYFCKKYGNAGRFLAVRSLAWFEDAESEPDPVFLNGWVWKDVRQRVEKLVEGIIK